MGTASGRWATAPLLAAAALALTPWAASADPQFTYTEKPKDDAKPPGWKAEIKGGLLYLTGNSQSLSVNAAARASYDAVWQKYSFLGDYTFSRATTFGTPTTTVTSLNQVPTVDGLSARLWDLGARFDQFLIHNNAQWETSLYVLALLGSDYAAGKKLTGDAQLGASTFLVKTGPHTLKGEGGFDFGFVDPYKALPGQGTYFVVSLRLALGYTWQISKTTQFTAGVEWLTNLNAEDAAYDSISSPDTVPVFDDNRINGKLGLTTQIYDALSLGVSFVVRYDSAPSLSTVVNPPPPGGGAAPPLFVYKTDTITTIQLIYAIGG
jgi:putative salt-induced outer membrane protein YdiY